MKCQFCPQKEDLIPLQELLGEPPHSHDFDKDGKLFKICPNCFSCDNDTLRTDRILVLKELARASKYSRRDKKTVLFLICNKKELSHEERKILVSDTMKEIKDTSDKLCVAKISEIFDLKKSRIEMLFYNIKVYRKVK